MLNVTYVFEMTKVLTCVYIWFTPRPRSRNISFFVNKYMHNKSIDQVQRKPGDSKFWSGLMRIKEQFLGFGSFSPNCIFAGEKHNGRGDCVI
jgi:hypothetical protein